VLAILINQRFGFDSPRCCNAGHFGSIALTWCWHPSALLIEPAWLRYVVAAALAFAPVFLREPRVQLLIPRYEDGRYGVRVEPVRARFVGGRWSTSRC
jgi:hypothetical protein